MAARGSALSLEFVAEVAHKAAGEIERELLAALPTPPGLQLLLQEVQEVAALNLGGRQMTSPHPPCTRRTPNLPTSDSDVGLNLFPPTGVLGADKARSQSCSWCFPRTEGFCVCRISKC